MAGFTINQVALSGALTRDPEHRTTAGGMDICKLRIAVTDRYKDKQTGDWADRPMYFDVTMFSGLGRWLSEHIAKGDSVAVCGRLNWHEWQTPDGQKRQTVDVIADSVVPIPKGGGQRSSSTASSSSEPASSTRDFDAPLPADDDIPF